MSAPFGSPSQKLKPLHLGFLWGLIKSARLVGALTDTERLSFHPLYPPNRWGRGSGLGMGLKDPTLNPMANSPHPEAVQEPPANSLAYEKKQMTGVIKWCLVCPRKPSYCLCDAGKCEVGPGVD